MEQIETLAVNRARVMVLAGLSFLLWQASAALGELYGNTGIFQTTLLLGGLLWPLAMLLFVFLGRKIARLKTSQQAALGDEHTQFNQARAFRIGYFTAILALTAGYVAIGLQSISPELALRLSFAITGAAPMLAFGFLELKNMRGLIDDE